MSFEPAHPVTEDFDWNDGVATLGDRLAKAREASAMSQEELARRLGVKVATLRNWENDRSEPRANRMQMLSGLLNVSFTWLMTGTVPPGGDSDMTPETDVSSAILREMRSLRAEQLRIAERMGLLEKRLRVAIGDS